jgi:hypothetical protein
VSADGSRARAVQSAAIIERLARLSPTAFFFHECQRLPLEIAIDCDLIALCKPTIERGLVTVADISARCVFKRPLPAIWAHATKPPRAVILPATWGGVFTERGGHAPNILRERSPRVEAAAAIRSTPQPAGTPPAAT